MSDTITANLTAMFRTADPYDCSNNQATLGDQCARLTWQCALSVAESSPSWLVTPAADACEGMRRWARETGAWDRDEIAAWTPTECLALFVQNVASELRMLGSDDRDLDECVTTYETTDWDSEPEYPTGCYYRRNGELRVEYYTGI